MTPNPFLSDTFVYKDKRTGWRAETKIQLGDGWQLNITTRKHHDGSLVSFASVDRKERGFLTHRMFADYSRNIIRRYNLRCTDKTIQALHDEALSHMENLMLDILAHYQAQEEPFPGSTGMAA
jgi:hypothetical protein